MQDLSNRQELMAQAMEELSKIKGIKLLHCRLQGVDHRKKLVSRDSIYLYFPLIRVLISYQWGNKGPVIVQSRLIYPNNVYPYGRKTLEVMEDIANERYVERASWKDMGDIFYARYEFSLDNLKRAVNRVNVAFNRLLAVGLIQALNIVEWRQSVRIRIRTPVHIREGEGQSFIALSFVYREKLFSGICGVGGMVGIDISMAELLISDFDLFRK